jgi:hypothetical protein
MFTIQRVSVAALLVLQLGACAAKARLPVTAGMGSNPALPAPREELIPTVKVAKAVEGGRLAERRHAAERDWHTG